MAGARISPIDAIGSSAIAIWVRFKSPRLRCDIGAVRASIQGRRRRLGDRSVRAQRHFMCPMPDFAISQNRKSRSRNIGLGALLHLCLLWGERIEIGAQGNMLTGSALWA